MTKPRRILWPLVLIVAGAVLLYLYLHRSPQPAQAFHAILNLTPDDLTTRCGTPDQNVTGLVAEGAGIRDLHYQDSDGNDLVFRFITQDDQNWQSLGAWQSVHAPDDLGSPVAAPEAAQRLRCVMKDASQATLLPFHFGGASGGLVVTAAAMLLPQVDSTPGTAPNTGPVGVAPMPAMPAAPMPSMPPPMPNLPLAAPAPVPTPGGSPNGSGGGGSEGGPEGAPPIPVVLPCPSDTEPCTALTYVEFLTEFNQAIHAEQQNDFDSALQLLTGKGTLVAQLLTPEDGRAEAIKTIVQLEVKALNIVEARLRDDLAKLEPLPSDSSDVKAQNLAVVVSDDQQRRQLWKQAVESNRPTASVSEESASPSAGGVMRFDSEAYRQLVQIHQTGNWP
ncbi:MAG: hypothetical protein WBP90_12570 [Terracidiphilus sp.]